jgi:hypothetical protein
MREARGMVGLWWVWVGFNLVMHDASLRVSSVKLCSWLLWLLALPSYRALSHLAIAMIYRP